MKKMITVLLALCLFTAAAIPATAADASFGSVTITDYSMNVTFSQAKTINTQILIARQSLPPEGAAIAQGNAVRKDIELIVVGPDCLVTRSGGGAMEFSFVTLNGSDYLVTADRMSLYTASFNVQTLLSFPFMKAEMAVLTLGGGKEYYIVSENTTVKEAPPAPIAYTVQRGDTEEQIALNYYGAAGLGEALKAANPDHYAASGGILEAGRSLTLPTTLNGVTLRKTPQLAPGESFYTIKSGDTLGGIALKYLGDASAYTRIVERNSGILKDASTMLRIGTQIILPAA